MSIWPIPDTTSPCIGIKFMTLKLLWNNVIFETGIHILTRRQINTLINIGDIETESSNTDAIPSTKRIISIALAFWMTTRLDTLDSSISLSKSWEMFFILLNKYLRFNVDRLCLCESGMKKINICHICRLLLEWYDHMSR